MRWHPALALAPRVAGAPSSHRGGVLKLTSAKSLNPSIDPALAEEDLQQQMGHLTNDGSPVWSSDGTLIPWSELQKLPSGEVEKAIARLTDADAGAGVIFSTNDFETEYTKEFMSYFPK